PGVSRAGRPRTGPSVGRAGRARPPAPLPPRNSHELDGPGPSVTSRGKAPAPVRRVRRAPRCQDLARRRHRTAPGAAARPVATAGELAPHPEVPGFDVAAAGGVGEGVVPGGRVVASGLPDEAGRR